MGATVLATGGAISLCSFLGLVVYARYADCDPISAKVSGALFI